MLHLDSEYLSGYSAVLMMSHCSSDNLRNPDWSQLQIQRRKHMCKAQLVSHVLHSQVIQNCMKLPVSKPIFVQFPSSKRSRLTRSKEYQCQIEMYQICKCLYMTSACSSLHDAMALAQVRKVRVWQMYTDAQSRSQEISHEFSQ